MCGISGVWDRTRPASLTQDAQQMLDTLAHRGPDDQGLWSDVEQGISIGNRRLAVVDLSPQGRQPMISPDGRYVLVYNGEIYNFQQLRHELNDYPYNGDSDTEVLLAALQTWGAKTAAGRSNGMFAFALWDRQTQTLTLGRDQLGIKPLYYGWQGDVFMFGSELKALCAHPAFQRSINREALPLYLRHDAIPAPYTIYEGIHKLPPGTLLTLSADEKHPIITPYWQLKDVVQSGLANPFEGTPQDAVHTMHELLLDAIKIAMISDVPLGAFLSGGIDSSTVVALMQAQSSRPVKTFTIGFDDRDYNEAQHAKAVAEHLGTDHTELYLNDAQARAVIARMPSMYDEPFADASQIPTFLVSHMARQHVTVCLSGDGGDELFGGYNRHQWVPKIWERFGGLPPAARKNISRSMTFLTPSMWRSLFKPMGLRQMGDKMQKVASMLQADSLEGVYLDLTSHWKKPTKLLGNAHEPLTAITQPENWFIDDIAAQLMYLDAMMYLPDDILTKVDRASMAVSLEARVPLLDHRVAELAWRMPTNYKIRDGQGKWLLRQILYQYVPPDLVERPKSGFAVPISHWLRHDLYEWANDLLDPQQLKKDGFFDPKPIRQTWDEHQSGKHNRQYALWDILMFQAWLHS